jgi:hypothetical protein
MRNNVHDFWAQRLLDQIIALITGEGLLPFSVKIKAIESE